MGIWALYLGLYAVTTVLFAYLVRNPDIRIAHGVLTYLLLIIGASRQGGARLSAVMVVISYLAVDYFFVPPTHALGGATRLNWLILIGFVLTGALISALFAQLQQAVAVAHERTLEVEQLSADRLQLEREASTARVLVEADRLKNALLGSIAHDLRSPVATLALLADPTAGFAPDKALQRVNDEAHRLSEFIGTLHRFASTNGGSGLLQESHDTDLLIHTALRSSEAMLRRRTVRTHAPSTPLAVWCDLTLTVHVLGNLLQNAARYSPQSAPIDVYATIAPAASADAPGLIEIIVADRGPGLAAADVERIFSPLRRTSPSTTGHEPNVAEARMGMGLSIARTFARAQGGDVQHRPREGGGSLFVIRLPHSSA